MPFARFGPCVPCCNSYKTCKGTLIYSGDYSNTLFPVYSGMYEAALQVFEPTGCPPDLTYRPSGEADFYTVYNPVDLNGVQPLNLEPYTFIVITQEGIDNIGTGMPVSYGALYDWCTNNPYPVNNHNSKIDGYKRLLFLGGDGVSTSGQDVKINNLITQLYTDIRASGKGTHVNPLKIEINGSGCCGTSEILYPDYVPIISTNTQIGVTHEKPLQTYSGYSFAAPNCASSTGNLYQSPVQLNYVHSSKPGRVQNNANNLNYCQCSSPISNCSWLSYDYPFSASGQPTFALMANKDVFSETSMQYFENKLFANLLHPCPYHCDFFIEPSACPGTSCAKQRGYANPQAILNPKCCSGLLANPKKSVVDSAAQPFPFRLRLDTSDGDSFFLTYQETLDPSSLYWRYDDRIFTNSSFSDFRANGIVVEANYSIPSGTIIVTMSGIYNYTNGSVFDGNAKCTLPPISYSLCDTNTFPWDTRTPEVYDAYSAQNYLCYYDVDNKPSAIAVFNNGGPGHLVPGNNDILISGVNFNYCYVANLPKIFFVPPGGSITIGGNSNATQQVLSDNLMEINLTLPSSYPIGLVGGYGILFNTCGPLSTSFGTITDGRVWLTV